jgi:hypothetical protein
MSRDDSIHWWASAEEIRALAEATRGEISKQVMHRIAEDYERFARTIEGRPNRFLPIPPAPAEASPRKDSISAPTGMVDPELPNFLKRRAPPVVELEAST